MHKNVPFEFIQTELQMKQMVQVLEDKSCFALDTEFIREKTFSPKVELFQVATEHQVWILDLQAFQKKKKALRGFLKFLKDPKKLKIIHAALGDQECFYSAYHVLAAPILDTAIAAELLGLGEQVGLAKLLKQILGISIRKGHTRTDWSRRPLLPEQLQYAAQDVAYLVKLGKELKKKLQEQGRWKWALRLCKKFSQKELFKPDAIAMVQKYLKRGKLHVQTYPLLMALLEFRERKIRELNIPRKWFVDEKVLLDLAQARPKSFSELKRFRGIFQKEIRHHLKELWNVIEKGQSKSKKWTFPKYKMIAPPSLEEERALELFHMVIKIFAHKCRISSRLFFPPQKRLLLLRSSLRTAEDLIPWLGPEIFPLAGKELFLFLKGKLCFRFEKGKLVFQKHFSEKKKIRD